MTWIFQFDTLLGCMTAAASAGGLSLLEFSRRQDPDIVISRNKTSFPDDLRYLVNEHIAIAIKETGEYFAGTRTSFSVNLAPEGSDFQRTVWQELLKIPYGTTITYKELASALDRPDSVRAVANASGANKISVIIPCHRVIGSNGSLTGYNGGLERKSWLLDHERKASSKEYSLKLF